MLLSGEHFSDNGASDPQVARLSEDLLSSAPWYQALARLHGSVGTAEFQPLLVAALKQITDHEHAVIIAYPRDRAPYPCFDDLPREQQEPTLLRYFRGAYLLDPFYEACAGSEPLRGVYKLRQLAPDEFYASEYSRTYYAATQLTEEVGVFIGIDDATTVVISLGIRSRRVRLHQDELRRLDALFPLLQSFCRLHYGGADKVDDQQTPAATGRLSDSLDLAFQNFGRDRLSQRELEITRLILRGHSSRSIGERLHISADTVKAHRKHVHTKLGISSQAELFSLFLEALAVIEQDGFADPLSLLDRPD